MPDLLEQLIDRILPEMRAFRRDLHAHPELAFQERGTARKVRELLPKAFFATLYAKPAGRPVVDLCVKEFAQSKWIHFPWDIEYRFATPIKDGGGVREGP